MTYVHTPSDKVQVRSQGELMSPGTCALCGTGTCDEGYVDTAVFVDFFGNVYYCMNCIRQIIGVIRALTPEEAAILTAQVNETAAENAALKAEVESLREYKSSIDSLIVGAIGGDLDLNFSLGLGANENATRSNESTDESPDLSGVGESVLEESVTDEGPDSVTSDERSDATAVPRFSL
jgi:hypothetical protein